MKTIHAVDRHGNSHVIHPTLNGSLMEALRDARLPVAAICGGAISCATCHVYLDESDFRGLGEALEEELELLIESPHFKPGESRLSCQIRVEELPNAMVVRLAPENP